MTDGIVFLRWVIICGIFQGISQRPARRLFGVGGEAFGFPFLLLLTSYLVWLWGSLSSVPAGFLPLWGSLGAATLLMFAAAMSLAKPQESVRGGWAAIVLFWGVFVAIAGLRAFAPALVGTEKFTDLAIFQAVTLDSHFPPQDRWLAGEPLNYYYFGHLLFGLLSRLTAAPPELGFNLALCTVAALTASVSYALARKFSQSRAVGCAAAFLSTAASNWEWVAQWGRTGAFSWWQSSRTISGTITEFPYFSFLLGDFHSHLIDLPWLALTLAAYLIFRRALREGEGKDVVITGAITALTLGAHYPLHPWAFPFAVALGTMFLGRRGWSVAILIPLALALFAPFWLTYERPVSSIGWVPNMARSSIGSFVLHWGIFLVPLFACALLVSLSEGFRERRLWMAAALSLAGFLWAPAASLTLGLLAWLWAKRFLSGGAMESVLLLGALAAIAGCEFVFFADAYRGGEHFRLNTVFKFYTMAWWALAVSVPVLIWNHRHRVAHLRSVLVATCGLSVAAGLVYPLWATGQRIGGDPRNLTLDGMAFWERALPGERAAVDWLRSSTRPDDVIWEAPGVAYDLRSRFASFSGRPTVLGWRNHELVWHHDGAALTEPRAAWMARLSASPSESDLAEFLRFYRVRWVLVGSLERGSYSPRLLELIGRMRPAFTSPAVIIYMVE